MRVLITGGSGFVGKYLMDFFREKKAELLSFSRSEGRDVRNKEDIREALKEFSPDLIFHLASIVRGRTEEEQENQWKVNVMGTKNLIEGMQEVKSSALLLFVSSSEVYGWATPPFSEKTLPFPANFYGITKLAGENIVLNGCKTGSIRAIVVRPFNHTGPAQSEDYVCSYIGKTFALIKSGKKEPVVEVGNLHVRREFLDVRDVVRIYNLLVERGREGEIYNVCRGESYSIEEIVKTFEEISGVEVEVKTRAEKRRVEPLNVVGNPEKLANLCELNFRPLKDTLAEIYEYWMERV